jgi:hypothetical protein
MKLALIGFVIMLVVLGALAYLNGDLNLNDVGALPANGTSSTPATPSTPAPAADDPFSKLKVN